MYYELYWIAAARKATFLRFSFGRERYIFQKKGKILLLGEGLASKKSHLQNLFPSSVQFHVHSSPKLGCWFFPSISTHHTAVYFHLPNILFRTVTAAVLQNFRL